MAVHSYPVPGGSTLLPISSIKDIAWPELKPGAGTPINPAVGYRLYRLIRAGPTTGRMVTSAPRGTMLPSLLRA